MLISLRISPELLALVDSEAELRKWSRNAAIVNLLWDILSETKEKYAISPSNVQPVIQDRQRLVVRASGNSQHDQVAEFYRLIRERRETQSLRSIGDELGVSKQAVYQWITGMSKPSKSIRMLAATIWR